MIPHKFLIQLSFSVIYFTSNDSKISELNSKLNKNGTWQKFLRDNFSADLFPWNSTTIGVKLETGDKKC